MTASDDALFLTCAEALDAIAIDFNQYPPQTDLFLKLTPLVTHGRMQVCRDLRQSGIWIQERGRRRRRHLTARELGRTLLKRMAAEPPSPSRLAQVCTAVFETASTAGRYRRREGIWVDTGMRHFTCRQCGACCRSLGYHDGLTDADAALWQASDRTDILAWVRTYRRGGCVTGYRIWVPPGTDRVADICPWLENRKGQGRYVCRIHALKPDICRQYPGSRKHARLTGCPGFG
jgi:Fe-S-cluster containining protein